MPPRAAALTGTFSLSDTSNEVICPLTNNDGSSCRKRCFGEKRYRSMQEHIRRAHPDYYIPKLPATEDSFQQMINVVPLRQERPPTPTYTQSGSSYESNKPGSSYESHTFYNPNHISPVTPRPSNDLRRPSLLPAATALAQLHNSEPKGGWDSEQEMFPDPDSDNKHLPKYIGSSDLHSMFNDTSQFVNEGTPGTPNPNEPFQSELSRALSFRATSLQPFPRARSSRPRKSSVTEHARKPKHERQRSKDQKRLSYERKAFSAEPNSLAGLGIANRRWEDLLDAAASATEEDSRDLTPILQSPRSSIPPFSMVNHGAFQSYTASPLQNAVLPTSPGPEEPTSPPFDAPHLEAFPSVESSYDDDVDTEQHTSYHHHNSSTESNPFLYPPHLSPHPRHTYHSANGSNFHMQSETLSSPSRTADIALSIVGPTQPYHHHYTTSNASSVGGGIGVPVTNPPNLPNLHSSSTSIYTSAPTAVNNTTAGQPGYAPLPPPPAVMHYCAACQRLTALTASYACTECICGVCRDCVDVLINMGPDRGAKCPRCLTMTGRFKPFMLDLR